MLGVELQARKGHVPRAVAGLHPLAVMESDRRLNLAIGLPLRNREPLDALLQQLYDPASPDFRRFITPEQFARQFGPTDQDYQAVLDFVRSNHLVLTGTHPNRLLVDVNGAVGDIERAFHLTLRMYQHPNEKRTFFAPDLEPSLDSRVPVLSIAGLDDYFLPRPMDLRTQLHGGGGKKLALRQPGSPQRNYREWSNSGSLATPALVASGSGPTGTFIGSDFRAAYAPGVALDGAGESVGLLELDNYYPNDISDYSDLAGLTGVPVTNVLVNGFNRQPGSNNSEVALDIEMTISMAPGLSRVIVYEGSIGNDILNRMATDNQARQLSCSWSFGHPVDATRQQILQQLAAQGQAFFQASGDSGAYGATMFPPADDPFVTAVGGTSLVTASPGGSWASETAWFGSGGGVSSSYSIPVWQKSLSMTANQGSLTMRNVPDVAALADNLIWVIANNGEQGTVGGTSAAAPLWAGFAALVNQQAAANHQPGIGFANPAIYAIGEGPGYSSAFHDITSGNNTNASSPNQFFAVPGYDLCTGWGTPNGSSTINALLKPSDSLSISPSSNFAVSGPVGGPFGPVLTGFTLSNGGSSSLAWTLNSTSTWLTVFPQSGTIATGAPPVVIALALSSVATNLVAGNYTADLWFTNLNIGFSRARQVTLAVVTPPSIVGQPSSQSLPVGATATFMVQPATNAFLSYQWQANGTNLQQSARIIGATAPTLKILAVGMADTGTYSLLISNAAGFASSLPAQLSVTSSPPIIATQPVGQTVLPGAIATLSVSAFGDAPLSYQWRANGTNLVDSATIAGSASNALTIAAVSAEDAKSYSVEVTNLLGQQTSAEAKLNLVVLTSPEIVQSTVHSFDGTNGGNPNGLTRGLDGGIYGTTQAGGPQSAGTVFKLDAAGAPHILQSFGGLSNGAMPNGGLVQASDGSLFGTTFGGGSNGFGTIFQLNSNLELSTIFTFDRTNGVLPTAGAIRGIDGMLYGTAYEGGVFHYGVVYRCDTNGGSFSVLVPFASTNGAFPRGALMRAADGSLFGTTYKGGLQSSGTVFRISTAGAFSTVVNFDGTNGAFTVAGLMQAADGTFYGTSTYGGPFGFGNVFRILPNGLVTNLTSFAGMPDGAHPRSALIQATDGNIYGTTSDGGSLDAGTVFRMSPDGVRTTIAEFSGFNGALPEAPLLEDLDGSLLGVTRQGGPFGQGVIFRLSIPESAPQITSQPANLTAYSGQTVSLSIASFGSAPLLYRWRENGTNLVDAGNILGSTTRTLTLLNVSPANSGTYSVIISNSFGSALSSGALLQVLSSAPLITLQPANQALSPGSTAVFHAGVLGNFPLTYQWQVNGTNLTDTANRSGSATDTLTITNVTEANNGDYTLFVTNSLGAASSSTATLLVVPVSAPGTRLATLYSFTGGRDGSNPSELAFGFDGFLYGTTEFGGDFLDGTVFKIGTNGGIDTIVSFSQTNGAFPLAGPVLFTNGNLYGTTGSAGSSGAGTVWTMKPSGVLSNVYSFTGGLDGGGPTVKLAEGSDHDFYGATLQGGANGLGTIFRMTPDGALSVLHPFSGGVDGASPDGALVELADGNLYGTTPSGGLLGQGNVFRVSPLGLFTNIYSFTGGEDGFDPVGALVLGDDGVLYGDTQFNTIQGLAFTGTLFRITTNGILTTLYALNFTDGSYPGAGLVLGADGNFYGTTQEGGANNFGTLFRLTTGGLLTTLVEFDGFNDGANPSTALTSGPDGSLYGTTSTGGPGGRGTIFRLSFSGAPQISAQPVSQTGMTGGNVAFSVAVIGGSPLSYQWQKNGTNLNDGAFVQGASDRVLKLGNLTLADAGSYSVTVTNSSGFISSSPALLTVSASAPVFQSIRQVGGNLELVWTSVAGATYRLQSRIDLLLNDWTDTGSPLTATGTSLETSVPIGPNSHEFYRVVLLP